MEVIQAPSLDFSFSEFNIPNYRRRAQFSNIQRRGKEAVGDPDCYLLLDSCSLVVNRGPSPSSYSLPTAQLQSINPID